MAIASLVLSLLWLGGLGSLLAVIFGHKAKGEIDRSGGRQGGRGLAIAGLVLGYLGLVAVIGLILITMGLLAATQNAVESADTSELEITLKDAATAQEAFRIVNEAYAANVSDLEQEGFSPYPGTELSIRQASIEGYCLEAESAESGNVMHFDSDEGVPRDGGC